MSVTVNINGLSLCHKGSGGWTAATSPDVCLTPPVPTPVPYPNFAYSTDLTGGTVTVFADGGNMIAHKPSIFATSTGDEPGTAGGVVSGTFMLEASWITFSADVRIEGENACRLTDKMLHNHGNTNNCGGEIQAPVFGNRMNCTAQTCSDTFAAINADVDQILAMTDPIERNKVISAKYAEVYSNNKELQWAGAAAFASKQVGCGMVQARDMTLGATVAGGGVGAVGGGAIGAGIGAFFGGVGAIPGWLIGTGIGALFGGGAGAGTGYAAATTMLDFLAKGNGAVFKEIYPLLKLYEFYKANCTEQAFKDCLTQLGAKVPPGVKQGFDDILAGRYQDGALKMLRHEQEFTLQTEVYDYTSFQAIMKVNEVTGLAPINVAYSSDCTAGANLTQSFTGGDLYNFNDRWPYAQNVANGFVDQAANNSTYIDQQLQNIIQNGGQ